MNYSIKALSKYKTIRNFSLNNVRDNQKKNHYDHLEITPKATQGDIKNAFYKLSKQYHPDINKDNPSASEKFKDIAEAYEILGNLKSRKLYDRGFQLRNNIGDNTKSAEPTESDKYQHASFYHQRNKPQKTTDTKNFRMYNLDEWTKAHYSETFHKSKLKKAEGHTVVTEQIVTKQENLNTAAIFGLLIMVMGLTLVYETNASENFDYPSVEEKPELHSHRPG